MATPSAGLPAISHAASATPAFRLSASATGPRAAAEDVGEDGRVERGVPARQVLHCAPWMPRSRGSSLHMLHCRFTKNPDENVDLHG